MAMQGGDDSRKKFRQRRSQNNDRQPKDRRRGTTVVCDARCPVGQQGGPSGQAAQIENDLENVHADALGLFRQVHGFVLLKFRRCAARRRVFFVCSGQKSEEFDDHRHTIPWPCFSE